MLYFFAKRQRKVPFFHYIYRQNGVVALKRYLHQIIRLLCWSAVVAGVGLACTGRDSLSRATSQAPDVRVISGRVLDAEGQPRSGAVVHFYGLSPVRSDGAAT